MFVRGKKDGDKKNMKQCYNRYRTSSINNSINQLIINIECIPWHEYRTDDNIDWNHHPMMAQLIFPSVLHWQALHPENKPISKIPSELISPAQYIVYIVKAFSEYTGAVLWGKATEKSTENLEIFCQLCIASFSLNPLILEAGQWGRLYMFSPAINLSTFGLTEVFFLHCLYRSRQGINW